MAYAFVPSGKRQRQRQQGKQDPRNRTPKLRSGKVGTGDFRCRHSDNLSLLSDQAILRAEFSDCTPSKPAHARVDSDADSALTAPNDSNHDEAADGDTATAAVQRDSSGNAAAEDPARICMDGACACVSDGHSAGEPAVSGTPAGGSNAAAQGTAGSGTKSQRARGKKKKGGSCGEYADIIGKEIDVPATIFDIQVPDLFYRAIVKRRDKAHKRAVVIRFPEDGSTFWLPVDEVRQYVVDTEARHGRGEQSLAGKGSTTFAAEVLVSLSGAGGSSATQQSSPPAHSSHPAAGGEAESAMQTPARKRRRKK